MTKTEAAEHIDLIIEGIAFKKDMLPRRRGLSADAKEKLAALFDEEITALRMARDALLWRLR